MWYVIVMWNPDNEITMLQCNSEEDAIKLATDYNKLTVEVHYTWTGFLTKRS